MAQYGMGDEATIDEVIEDVDTDKVIIFSWTLIIFIFSFYFHNFFLYIFFKKIGLEKIPLTQFRGTVSSILVILIITVFNM
jgi:hypothetical protein